MSATVETAEILVAGIPTYIARPELEMGGPEKTGLAPSVVIIHEAWGLTDDILCLTRLAAASGFMAAAPDLLAGYNRVRAVRDAARGHGSSFHRIIKVIEWLGNEGGADPARTGAIGLSMGATLALRLATRGHLSAVAAFYGFTPPDEELSTCCPVVASYGANDRLVRDQGARLQKALDEKGIANDIKVYPDAGHSFMTGLPAGALGGLLTPVFGIGPNVEATEDAWSRTRAFLTTHI